MKNVLDTLENDIKVNFQENIRRKVRFQKKWKAWAPPLSRGLKFADEACIFCKKKTRLDLSSSAGID